MRKKRKRSVFGKRRIQMHGTTYLIHMRKDHVTIRELRSKREYSLTLQQLADALMA